MDAEFAQFAQFAKLTEFAEFAKWRVCGISRMAESATLETVPSFPLDFKVGWIGHPGNSRPGNAPGGLGKPGEGGRTGKFSRPPWKRCPDPRCISRMAESATLQR